MAVVVAMLLIAGAVVIGVRLRVSSQEAGEAKRRLAADLAARSALPTERLFSERRFGTDEERNDAEAVPQSVEGQQLAPAIQRLLAEDNR